MGVAVSVGVRVCVNVAVGSEVRVGESVKVNVGRGVRVGDGVAVRIGVRVGVEEGVGVPVDVGVDEEVGVAVCVRVGVRDNAAIANCASSVLAARVASTLRSCVGEGLGVRVIVPVAVGGCVRVGGRVEVEAARTVGVTEAGSGVVRLEISVWVCLRAGEGASVAVRWFRFVPSGVGVLVERIADGTVPVGAEGIRI